MVKQNQADLLDYMINGGSDLSDLLTFDGEVIGFQGAREEEDAMNYLEDEVTKYIGHNENYDAQLQDPLTTLEALAVIVQDQEITFDPTDTDFEASCLTEIEMPSVIQEIELPAAGTVTGEKEDGVVPVSPLIKEEIKNKIKLRRKAEGKGEIKVEFTAPEPERLTKEEEERRIMRRMKNKMAAQKCRSKKRKIADTLEEEMDRLTEKQESLLEEIQKLRDEKEHLQELVKVHSYVCPKMARGK